MKRANEALVGIVVIAAVVTAVFGTMWLSGQAGAGDARIVTARYRSIGGLKGGNPVLLRGVKVGTVGDVRLAPDNWVEVDLKLDDEAVTPPRDTVVAVIRSTTLFGDWGVDIVTISQLDDPTAARQADEARRYRRDAVWPGATFPDIGQITAQASRIAGDIGVLAGRVESAFDSTSVRRLQNSLRDFSVLSRSLASIARAQESSLINIGANLRTGTASLAAGAAAAAAAAHRADSAIDRAQVQRTLANADSAAATMLEVANNLRRLTAQASRQDTALARLIANTDSVIQRIQRGQGTLGRLTGEDSLYTAALQTIRSLNRFIDKCERNPRTCFAFTVF